MATTTFLLLFVKFLIIFADNIIPRHGNIIMKPGFVNRRILEPLKFALYPRLNRLAEIAVNGIPDIDAAISRRIISGKREVVDWLSIKADEVKRRLYSISTLNQKAVDAGFNGIEEARAAVRAVNGELLPSYEAEFHPREIPVLRRIDRKAYSDQSAYIIFLLFLGDLGKGSLFRSIDSSMEGKDLLERAKREGFVTEIKNGSHFSTWAVFKDPMAVLQQKVEQLPVTLFKLLS